MAFKDLLNKRINKYKSVASIQPKYQSWWLKEDFMFISSYKRTQSMSSRYVNILLR